MGTEAQSETPEEERAVLGHLESNEQISDSEEFARSRGFDHDQLSSVIKSLHGFGYIEAKDIRRDYFVLTEEAVSYTKDGSPEWQVFQAVPPEGITKEELQTKLDRKLVDVGMSRAVRNKWLQPNPISRKVAEVEDIVKQQLLDIKNGKKLDDNVMTELKKRKLITPKTSKGYSITRGPKYAPTRSKAVTDLTREMILNGTWKDTKFKEYNFEALGQPPEGGHLHPLLKVRTKIRQIFLEMGFEEMKTNNFVESSFWNFDALFQPQQHPARDSHDTFFLKTPATTQKFPEDYLERVKKVHESGGYGSIGYVYDWKREEAEKNVLRTHTTAVSARVLYDLAQNGFVPKRHFSIDRVFRNEAVDRTHLAEFHQIEGLICDKGLTLGDLIGVLNQFFSRLGMTNLRFKPAYNPYTEPSMEIFSYHDKLQKWMEVGNSGIFRPEMLRPMGFPEDVSVIAWGLSLERPTMILYGYENIRDLFGHKVDLISIKKAPICRMGMQPL